MAGYVIGGDIGSGKTLRCLQLMWDAVKAGRPVYTNIELTPDCPFYEDVFLIGTRDFPVAVDFMKGKPINLGAHRFRYFWEYVEKDAFVVIDEGDIYFDSAMFSEMARETRIYHKQLRKFGHDLLYIVQRIPSLYNRIRSLATTFIYAENTYRTFRPFRALDRWLGPETAIKLSRFNYYEYADETLAELRSSATMSYGEATQYFGWYRTDQLLGDTLTLLRPQYGQKGGQDEEAGPAGIISPA